MKRARWFAAAGALVAAAWIFGFFVDRDPPSFVLRLFAGGPSEAIDIHGGMRGVYRLPGADAKALAHAARALVVWGQARHPGAGAHVDGDGVVVDLPGADDDDTPAPAGNPGTELMFKMVVENAPAMRALGAKLDADDEARQLGISSKTEEWSAEDGTPHEDAYLAAADGVTLETWVARASPGVIDANHEIVIEDTRARPTGKPSWRTYYVERVPILDASSIIDAVAETSRYTNRPEVLVTFDRAGAERFADVTAANIGHKIAIIVDGLVTSAPVIQTAIRGGRCTITLGAGDPDSLKADAERLAANLRSGPLPAGLVAVSFDAVPITVSEGALTGARVALAAAGGIIALALLLIVALVVVRDAPALSAPVAGAAGGKWPWGRLLVTLVVPAAVYAGRWVLIPGLAARELEDMPFDVGGGQLSVFALGLIPFLTAFLLVEVAALIVPPWRRLRVGDASARSRLGVATAILGVLLAGLQAWMIVLWLESLGPRIMPPGLGHAILTGLTLVTGAVVLVALAGLVSRHGLANGYAALLLPGFVLDAISGQTQPGPENGPLLVAACGAAAIALVTAWLLTSRPKRTPGGPGFHLPASGIAPLAYASSLLFTLIQLSNLGVQLPSSWFDLLQPERAIYRLLDVALVAAMGALFAYWFTRRRPAPQVTTKAAIAWSVGYLLALRGFQELTTTVAAGRMIHSVAIACATAVAIDLVAEWRARVRLGDLVDVWPLHRVQLAGIVEEALATAGIPVYLRTSRLRTLLQFFGPFAPISVLVPRATGVPATEIVRGAVTGSPASPAAQG